MQTGTWCSLSLSTFSLSALRSFSEHSFFHKSSTMPQHTGRTLLLCLVYERSAQFMDALPQKAKSVNICVPEHMLFRLNVTSTGKISQKLHLVILSYTLKIAVSGKIFDSGFSPSCDCLKSFLLKYINCLSKFELKVFPNSL